MSGNNARSYPPLWMRLYSVWYRHMRVYTRNLISNAFPPFLEPLIFLAGIGIGLGALITDMGGMPYLTFLATGLSMTASMWAAAFECTFGTFVRLEFNKSYDGMLSASITAADLIVGELLWVASKGFFFALAVLLVVSAFRIAPFPLSLVAAVVGCITGLMFGALSIFVTSFVRTINHFNFYFTGLLSPMFFFCGVVFPVEQLPAYLRPLAEAMPLTHAVRMTRAICLWQFDPMLPWGILYCVVFIALMGTLAVRGLRRRLID